MSPEQVKEEVEATKDKTVELTRKTGDAITGTNRGFLSHDGINVIAETVVIEDLDESRGQTTHNIPARNIHMIRQTGGELLELPGIGGNS